MNTVVHGEHPGVLTSPRSRPRGPACPGPSTLGGLGFTHKWNMGWMHDTLDYFSQDPVHRRCHHHELTFGLIYAWTRELRAAAVATTRSCTARGRCSARCRATAGSSSPTCGRCYAWMWAHPGKQLLFMGGELAQEAGVVPRPSASTGTCSTTPAHRGVQRPRARAQPAAGRPSRRCGPTTSRPRASAGSTPTTASTACYSFLRASAGGGAARGRASPTSRPCRATATGSGCPGRALGRAVEHRRRPVGRQRHRATRR